MCLSNLANFKISNYWGWQLFEKMPNGKLQSFYYRSTNDGVETAREGQWMKDKKDYTIDAWGRPYRTGYHIYLNKKSAERHLDNRNLPRFTIRKVLFILLCILFTSSSIIEGDLPEWG